MGLDGVFAVLNGKLSVTIAHNISSGQARLNTR